MLRMLAGIERIVETDSLRCRRAQSRNDLCRNTWGSGIPDNAALCSRNGPRPCLGVTMPITVTRTFPPSGSTESSPARLALWRGLEIERHVPITLPLPMIATVGGADAGCNSRCRGRLT